MKRIFIIFISSIIASSCGSGGSGGRITEKSHGTMGNDYQVRLIIVDPGHFHAALVQKIMYPQVSPDVRVYAPDGPDVQQYLDRIVSYNTRSSAPASWNEIVYKGDDFFEKMLYENAGNVVVLSGNNRKKAEYISRSVGAGLNVLADKPMIISPDDFTKLEDSFLLAREKGVLIYDIMTERFEITTLLQKLLSRSAEIFGKLESGTKDDPAVTKVSVHHFSKIVSGSPVIRPAWFFDTDQQGEGIVDVTTHLVDLVQWECFPEEILTPSDITIAEARRWPTILSFDEFRTVTGCDELPPFLLKDFKDGKLNVYCNGDIIYQIKGVWAKVSVTWNYIAPPGAGDTHYSVMKGSNCDLVIKQGAEEKYVPTLYIEKIKGMTLPDFTGKLKDLLERLPYDNLQAEVLNNNTFKINIPEKYRVSHEEHFAQVTSRFLEYLKEGKLPDWEVKGMITKYYTTTSALKKAKDK